MVSECKNVKMMDYALSVIESGRLSQEVLDDIRSSISSIFHVDVFKYDHEKDIRELFEAVSAGERSHNYLMKKWCRSETASHLILQKFEDDDLMDFGVSAERGWLTPLGEKVLSVLRLLKDLDTTPE